MDPRFCELQDEEVEQAGKYVGKRRCLKFKYMDPNATAYCPYKMGDIDIQSKTGRIYVSLGEDASDRCADFELLDSAADVVLIDIINRADNNTKLTAAKKLFRARCAEMKSRPTPWRLEEQISKK